MNTIENTVDAICKAIASGRYNVRRFDVSVIKKAVLLVDILLICKEPENNGDIYMSLTTTIPMNDSTVKCEARIIPVEGDPFNVNVIIRPERILASDCLGSGVGGDVYKYHVDFDTERFIGRPGFTITRVSNITLDTPPAIN